MEKYTVKKVKLKVIEDFFIYQHYMKRKPINKYCFGFYCNDNLIGGCVFSTAPSAYWNNGGHLFNNKHIVLVSELSRVFIEEKHPKNTLSFLLSQSFKLLQNPCVIVSYADTQANHNGYIYQALNFKYYGLSKPMCKSKDYYYQGKKYSGRTMNKELILKLCGDKYDINLDLENNFINIGGFSIMNKPKHRYILIKASKTLKRNLLKNISLTEFEYPKGENKRYVINNIPNKQLNIKI